MAHSDCLHAHIQLLVSPRSSFMSANCLGPEHQGYKQQLSTDAALWQTRYQTQNRAYPTNVTIVLAPPQRFQNMTALKPPSAPKKHRIQSRTASCGRQVSCTRSHNYAPLHTEKTPVTCPAQVLYTTEHQSRGEESYNASSPSCQACPSQSVTHYKGHCLEHGRFPFDLQWVSS